MLEPAPVSEASTEPESAVKGNVFIMELEVKFSKSQTLEYDGVCM